MSKYGAYSGSEIYSPKDVRDLVLYARLRGVKVVPELDAPAHAGNGWQWGSSEGLGELSLCVNAEPWREFCGQPPCGQLNPLNPFTYIVLGEIYKDMLDLFDRDLFHMGGDEIFFQCWHREPEVAAWARNHSTHDLMDLWAHFQTPGNSTLRPSPKYSTIFHLILFAIRFFC
jgi:hexosaminidase